MFGLLLAAALPALYWDQGPATASAVKEAAIESLYVPAAQAPAWQDQGLTAQAFEQAKFVRLPVPGVRYKMNVAAATNQPWVDANGWRFARDSRRAYYYDVPWRKAALAAAEAYAYGVEAVVHPDARDLVSLGKMVAFLRSAGASSLPALANIGIVDDGSAETGEILNLLARRNLLFRVIPSPGPEYDLTVRIGTAEFPKAAAADPSRFATLVRQKLTDEKRLLRIYGSDVVLARLTGDDEHARLHLINYGGGRVEGLRVRIRGMYARGELKAFGVSPAALEDYTCSGGATEFTIPEMEVYAVADLTK